MRLKNLLICGILAACLLTAACPAPCELEDAQVNAVYEELKPVKQALENYRQAENKYPQKLDELVPRYLPSVPQKAGGRVLSYIPVSEKEYNLRIAAPNGGTYSGSCSMGDIEDRWKELNKK